jgi:hypothetical protein
MSNEAELTAEMIVAQGNVMYKRPDALAETGSH